MVTILISLSGFGIAILSFIMPIYIEAIKPYAPYILWFGIFLTVIPWILACILSCIKKKKERIIEQNLRFRYSRLKAYNETRDFLHFCTTYWTKYCQGMVKGTNDLINRLDLFKDSIASEGPLNMPNVESNIKDIIKKTWRLQRFIDRIAILRPPNQDYYNIEDDIHALIDWFAQQEKGIEKLFEPHLKI